VAEHSILNFVPFARAKREMADDDFDVLALCPLMESVFPEAAA
jgi:hypothetical protein